MASTRNKNTKGDYLQEQESNRQNFLYRTYEHSQYGKPCNFLDVYKLPNNTSSTRAIAQESLSYNPIEIESYLKGISATNLEISQSKLNPRLKEFSSIKMHDNVSLLLPNQIKTDQKQRPLLI
tara:strand:+ start:59 stop:427 length:369 start_codon:yes stop_codon:yes gene_type:complete